MLPATGVSYSRSDLDLEKCPPDLVYNPMGMRAATLWIQDKEIVVVLQDEQKR